MKIGETEVDDTVAMAFVKSVADGENARVQKEQNLRSLAVTLSSLAQQIYAELGENQNGNGQQPEATEQAPAEEAEAGSDAEATAEANSSKKPKTFLGLPW